MYSKILETANWIRSKMTTKPETAIILGTGLGAVVDHINIEIEIPYGSSFSAASYIKSYTEGKNITLTLSRNEGDVEGSDLPLLAALATLLRADEAAK